MKNKYEMSIEARALAESLLGETNQKKVKTAVIEKFDSLGLDDADYPAFEQMVYQFKASNEGLKNQPLETEKIRLAAEHKAAADKKPETAAA